MALWVIRKSDSQGHRVLVNAMWPIECREAHASHGWDSSEAWTRSGATVGSRAAGVTLDGGENGGNRGSIC